MVLTYRKYFTSREIEFGDQEKSWNIASPRILQLVEENKEKGGTGRKERRETADENRKIGTHED